MVTRAQLAQATKDNPAAQQDSLDDSANCGQAPPSYEDQPSSSNEQTALLGDPISNEDNDLVAKADIATQMQFARKVYAIL
jgi:protein lifeguard